MQIKKILFTANIKIPLIVFTLFLIVGLGGYQYVQKELKSNIAGHIQSTHKSSLEALQIWIRNKQSLSTIWANDQRVRSNIQSLIQVSKANREKNKENLINSKALQSLRQTLLPTIKKLGLVGFVVFDTTKLQIAALLDESIGKRTLMNRSNFVERSLSGETVMSIPFIAGVKLPDLKGVWRKDWPTMFVSSPVRNDDGKIIGALAFRIRPELDFNRILKVGHLETTGETYAFNSSGQFISDSRFDPELIKIGLLPNDIERKAILDLDVRDPGGNLFKGFKTNIPRKEQPLTRMAADAIQGKSGVDVNGYNDYRGVPVVGAWTWLSNQNFGIATEMDLAEAYSALRHIIWVFGALFSLLVLGWSATIYIRFKQLHGIQENTRLSVSLQKSQGLTSAILNTTVDAIITIDSKGIIDQFNISAEKMFGYKSTEVLGENINMLMPEPYHSEHDGYLENYLNTGKASIIGVGREVVGLREDGASFPMDLSISELVVGERKMYTGIVRDITHQKKLEEEKATLIKNLENTNVELEEFSYRTSHDLKAPLVNIRGLSQIMQEDLEDGDYKEVSTNIQKVSDLSVKLENLVGDIVEIAKTDNEDEKLEEVDIAKELVLIKEKLNVLIDEKQVALQVSLIGNQTIWAQRSIIQRVFENLISNAIKYSDPQKPERFVKVEATKLNNGTQIKVSDNGLGIPDECLSEVFGMFKRFHKASAFGSGLGLYLVKKNLEKVNGEISVESDLEGTIFTIFLPVHQHSPVKI